MAERDGAAMRVELRAGGIDAEFTHRGDDLGGERLVELDEVEIADRQAKPCHQLPAGRHRADAHDIGLYTRRRHAENAGLGVRPCRFTAASEAMNIAAAPSLIARGIAGGHRAIGPHHGLSFASASSVVSGRGCSSTAMNVSPFLPGIVTGTISSAK